MFSSGTGDRGHSPGRVIPKIKKMVLDASQLNSLHYNIRIKTKVEHSREKSSALYLFVVAIDKGASESTSTTIANNLYSLLIILLNFNKIKLTSFVLNGETLATRG